MNPGRTFDSGGPTLAETGEAEVLRRLATAARTPGDPRLAVGSGDDAAVWRPDPGDQLVISQDALVEGKDFRRGWITPWQLGRRAVAMAFSDIAGMGAQPAWCTATLCAPGSTELDDLLAIQAGLCRAAADAGGALIGGDVSDIDGPLVIDVAVGGSGPPESWLLRHAGIVDDALIVTGRLGRAAAGLRILLGDDVAAGATDREAWLSAWREPVARIAEGRTLSRAGVRCGGDISDGLLVEAARVADASECGAELWLDAIPVDAALSAAFGADWGAVALGGGEDFELLAAVDPRTATALLAGWPAGAAPLSVVGRLVEGSGVRVLATEGGEAIAPPPITSRHYR